MRDPVRDFVDAEVQSDLPRMEQIVAASASDNPNLNCLKAVVESRRVAGPTGTAEQCGAALRTLAAVLSQPPRDAELFQIVLARMIRLACRVGKTGEACRAMRLLDAAVESRTSRPQMEAMRLLCSSHVKQLLGDYAGALENAGVALKLLGDRRDRLWYLLKASRITVAVQQGELETAEGDLSDLESVPEEKGILLGPMAYLKVQVLMACCRYEEALAILGSVSSGNDGPVRQEMDTSYSILMLSLCLRFEEARAMLETCRDALSPFHYLFLLGNIEMYEENWPEARRHLQQALASHVVRPRDVQSVAGRLASVELACRRPGAARALLANVGEGFPLPMLWCRVYALEGDEKRAAEHFRHVLAGGRQESIGHHLLCAPELSAHQLGRIWRLASAGAASQDVGRTAPSAAQPIQSESRSETGPAELVGETPVMQMVKADIARFGPLDETVLVTGKTGTGKELVARMLHAAGDRGKLAFLAVNCAAISDTLLESELFGHVRGAFTGAERAREGLLVAAGGGTLFFDEIGSMSPRLQGAMLRVLEERKVRPVGGTRLVPIQARIVAATNQPLEDLVKAGSFRQDLYYRLARLEIRLPPLRERREDILPLVRHFLRGYLDGGNVAVGDDLLEELKRHDWPGNVRELANTVQRMVIMAGDAKVLGAELFRGQVEGVPSGRGREDGVGRTMGAAVTTSADARRPRLRSARGRLAELRRLFEEHRELSRSDAMQLLGCAGGTAAKLLASLEAEGLVTRVEPTPVARTHYFRLRSSQAAP